MRSPLRLTNILAPIHAHPLTGTQQSAGIDSSKNDEDRPAGRSHQWLPVGLRWPQCYIRRITASRVERCSCQESRTVAVYTPSSDLSSVAVKVL